MCRHQQLAILLLDNSKLRQNTELPTVRLKYYIKGSDLTCEVTGLGAGSSASGRGSSRSGWRGAGAGLMTKASRRVEARGPGAAPASPMASRTAPRMFRMVSPVFTRRDVYRDVTTIRLLNNTLDVLEWALAKVTNWCNLGGVTFASTDTHIVTCYVTSSKVGQYPPLDIFLDFLTFVDLSQSWLRLILSWFLFES